jgi:hypothetical protein
VDYVGPFEHHEVVVDGWQVPFLEATPLQGGRVSLTLDKRFGLDLDLADAERIVPFLANAIAVGMGYESHPDSDRVPIRRSGPRRFLQLDWTESEEAP